MMLRSRWPYRAWVAIWVFVGLDAVTAFFVGVTATLTNSSRLGYTEIPLVLGGIVAGVIGGAWADEQGAPQPPPKMSREDRARFKRERSRQELAVRTRASELELGISQAEGEAVTPEYLPEVRRDGW